MIGHIIATIITMTVIGHEDIVYTELQAAYPDRQIEIVDCVDYDELTNRNGKVIVEHYVATSDGNGKAWDNNGYYTPISGRYSEGEKVNVYAVYNPNNNAEDDIVKIMDFNA